MGFEEPDAITYVPSPSDAFTVSDVLRQVLCRLHVNLTFSKLPVSREHVYVVPHEQTCQQYFITQVQSCEVAAQEAIPVGGVLHALKHSLLHQV